MRTLVRGLGFLLLGAVLLACFGACFTFLSVDAENVRHKDMQDGIRGADVERTVLEDGSELICVTAHGGFSPDMECSINGKPMGER